MKKLALVQSDSNPLRRAPFDAQIRHFRIGATVRTLQAYNKKTGWKRFKMAPVSSLKKRNKDKRTAFGWEHKDHTVENYWQYVYFTDEAHIDPH